MRGHSGSLAELSEFGTESPLSSRGGAPWGHLRFSSSRERRELVTNAVRYSEDNVLVRMRWAEGPLRVTVRDTSYRPLVAADGPVAANRTRGRGLFLVRRLAHRWGHYGFARSTGGKAVWFELLA